MVAPQQKVSLRALGMDEQTELERLGKAQNERVDRVRRARALLVVAHGQSFAAAARQAGFRSGSTVADLVGRFNARGLAALHIAAGRGRKPTYASSARAQIVATAQRAPDRRQDGTATWSLRLLQRTLRREDLPRIGTSTIRRVLQDAGSSYQRTRSWCPTGTAQRVRKTGVVTVVDPETERKRALIELAYRLAEVAGIPVWCQDEAGPYGTVPYPGASWQPAGHPASLPHEYARNGTAKLLTLFRPATGEVRATGVRTTANAVLHPWLQAELSAILAQLPVVPRPEAAHSVLAQWETWLGRPSREPLPPLRLLLIWDNLAGHLSASIVRWLFQQGIMPLYTPLSGSWLNMAEALQRIIVPRALAGQHPQTPEAIIDWLDDTVANWNEAPTPFVWDGKRRERRRHTRQRCLAGSPAVPADQRLFAA
jgi:transposase